MTTYKYFFFFVWMTTYKYFFLIIDNPNSAIYLKMATWACPIIFKLLYTTMDWHKRLSFVTTVLLLNTFTLNHIIASIAHVWLAADDHIIHQNFWHFSTKKEKLSQWLHLKCKVVLCILTSYSNFLENLGKIIPHVIIDIFKLKP